MSQCWLDKVARLFEYEHQASTYEELKAIRQEKSAPPIRRRRGKKPTMEILKNSSGFDTFYIHGAVVSNFGCFINPKIPYIWIIGHMPNPMIQWWHTELPINTKGKSLEANFRLVSYDLMLTTEEFLKNIHAFNDHGIDLIQSNNRMPDTLAFAPIPHEQRDKILIRNGAFLRIDLPHAVETGLITCFQENYLSKLIKSA